MNWDFYSVSDFDSTFLPPVIYWIENFKKHQVLIYFFSEKKIFGILAFEKSFFSVVVFYSKNLKLSIFRLFRKNWFWGRYFWGKMFYESNFLKRIRCRFNFCTTPQFLNPECSKMSNFEPTSCSSSKFESRFL